MHSPPPPICMELYVLFNFILLFRNYVCNLIILKYCWKETSFSFNFMIQPENSYLCPCVLYSGYMKELDISPHVHRQLIRKVKYL